MKKLLTNITINYAVAHTVLSFMSYDIKDGLLLFTKSAIFSLLAIGLPFLIEKSEIIDDLDEFNIRQR